MPTTPASYIPSSYFYRTTARATRTHAEAVALCLDLVAEHEALREWVRDQGMIPPKWFVTPSERASRAEGVVFPFSTTVPASAREA